MAFIFYSSFLGLQADMLLSRNLIIKKMYEQLQEAERSKRIRLKPKQGNDCITLAHIIPRRQLKIQVINSA
jgi:hypothetical protein